MILDLNKNENNQKKIDFPVTIRCKPLTFYNVPQMREFASELYPEGNKEVSDFLDKLEEE